MKSFYRLTAALAAAACCAPLHADPTTHPADHAPIGVMADHRHAAGEWMLSYRYMRMQMQGSRDSRDRLSADTIATTVANRFAGRPMQPPTLRVVPLQMTMDMQMLGLMWAPNNWVTGLLMGQWISKEMEHVTYQGGTGTNQLGRFTTRAEGWGDTTVAALIGPPEALHGAQRWHFQVGLSLPTGSNEEQDQVLAPNGNQPVLRLPYPMQLGSGTYDLVGGATWSQRSGRHTLGAQYQGVVRQGKNDQGYALGDVHGASLWLARDWTASLGSGLRLNYEHRSKVDGMDPAIVAPVQTADPDNYGGKQLWAQASVNTLFAGHRIAVEAGLPLWRKLNGPQLETDWSVTLGYQRAF